MKKASLTVAACATLLWAGTAFAKTTPQQKCDSARITAWKTYVSCMDTVVAKNAKGLSFNELVSCLRSSDHNCAGRITVIPANAGIHLCNGRQPPPMDARFRGHDEVSLANGFSTDFRHRTLVLQCHKTTKAAWIAALQGAP